MLKVGLSGGIGSGKSTVSGLLQALGATIIDADQLARDVVAPGTEGLAAVSRAFGPEILAADGRLDRSALGRVVFGDEARRRELEGIIHPLVAAHAQERFAAAAPGEIVVHDVPLLVEKQMMDQYHLVLIVDVDQQTRVARLMASRGMTEPEARSRMAAQASDEARRDAADVLVDNNSDQDSLAQSVSQLWHQRLAPYAKNLKERRPAPGHPLPPTPRTWARIKQLGGPAPAGFFPLAEDPAVLGSADPSLPVRLGAEEVTQRNVRVVTFG